MRSGHINTCTECVGKKYYKYRRDWEIRKEFGISLEEYNRRKTPCEICYSEINLHLDHNHQTKQLRGFLCVNCNMGIGQFKDDIFKLQQAIIYLEKYGQASSAARYSG